MAEEAGLVPCAESGMSILTRLVSPRSLVVGAHDQHTGQFAVRAGSRLQGHGGKAGDFLQPFLQRDTSEARLPWTVSIGWSGWVKAKPGRRAVSSLIFGLYFIVQEPSG